MIKILTVSFDDVATHVGCVTYNIWVGRGPIGIIKCYLYTDIAMDVAVTSFDVRVLEDQWMLISDEIQIQQWILLLIGLALQIYDMLWKFRMTFLCVKS